jgi:hypothetical protein
MPKGKSAKKIVRGPVKQGAVLTSMLPLTPTASVNPVKVGQVATGSKDLLVAGSSQSIPAFNSPGTGKSRKRMY